MEIKTGDSNLAMHYEKGERVYPCRCGKTHRGDYAAYDYGHHNCFHEATLFGFPARENKIQALCPDCGMSWIVEINKDS